MSDATMHAQEADESKRPIDIVLNNFDKRLKRIERLKRDTFLEKVQKNAAFLALLIGIILSLFSLFDALWTRPREQLDRDISEFNKTANTVAALRQSIAEASGPTKDPQAAATIGQMVMPQILSNIYYAYSLLGRIGDHAGIAPLLVLADEAVNIHDWDNANSMLNMATAKKNQPPFLICEAYRHKAKLLYLSGHPAEGSAAFADSLKAMEGDNAWGADSERALVSMEWMISGLMVNNCPEADNVAGKMMTYMANPQIQDTQRKAMIESMKTSLALIRTSCPLPNAIQGLYL